MRSNLFPTGEELDTFPDRKIIDNLDDLLTREAPAIARDPTARQTQSDNSILEIDNVDTSNSCPDGLASSSSGGVSGAVRNVLNGVVEYNWHHGCGPTAAGMVLGYWDRNGFANLVQGDSTTQTAQVNAMIASDQHFADYSQPLDDNTQYPIRRDRSQLGGAHVSNCLADFMHTSWSSDGQRYGWSSFSMVDDAIENYSNLIGYSGFDSWNETWGDFTWNDFVTEIDNGRPMVFLVDSAQNSTGQTGIFDGITDHFVTAIGYDSTTRQYACQDTWGGTGIRWFDFAENETGQPWGIYGATFINPSLLSRQYQYDYNLGSLDSTPKHQRTHLQQGLYENDVYKFNISSTRNLNLFLNDISAGDDADLYLYRDSNNNGFLDEIDTLIERPYRGGNANEWINVRAETGTYFARVNLYSGGSDGRIDYDLDLSATPINPSPPEDPSKAPNLLPKEIELGDIRLGTILLSDPNHSRTINQTGDISNSDTVDTYHFTASSRGDGVGIRVSLTGLSNDADVRLIEDRDRDGMVDLGEVIKSSALGGIANESFEIGRSNSSLSQYDYFVQVYQFSGNTNYNLSMTFTSTLM